MDSGLGEAFSKGNLAEHLKIGVAKTKQFLDSFPELSQQEKEKIVACVSEHHGASQFSCLESEICCNTDCYRFTSVQGVLGGMVMGLKMELNDLVQLYLQKAEEKWQILSLDMCKKELEPQYKAIKTFLSNYHRI